MNMKEFTVEMVDNIEKDFSAICSRNGVNPISYWEALTDTKWFSEQAADGMVKLLAVNASGSDWVEWVSSYAMKCFVALLECQPVKA